jgi:hypothetical protein
MTGQERVPAPAPIDELARAVDAGALSRRRVTALVASTIFCGTLGGASLDDAAAKRKKKKRKNRKNDNDAPPPEPAPVGAVVTCANILSACGLGTNTSTCLCLSTTEGVPTCSNIRNPPNGATFQPCQQTVNCPPGQVCNVDERVCVSTCQTA